MKRIELLIIFFSFILINSGCDLIFNEPEEKSIHYRDILKTYVLDISNRESKFLCDGENPVPIPNSTKILFKNDDKLYTINLDGSEKKYISNAPGAASNFAFYGNISSDGQKFVFVGQEEKYIRNDLLLIDVNGNGYYNLTKSPDKSEVTPIFNPTNDKILYQENMYDESNNIISSNISIIDIDGNNYKKIFDEIGGYYLQFAFNGEKIIFFRYSSYTGSDLYILDLNNNQNVEIVHLGSEHPFPTPIVTPDNNILYSADESDVYKVDLGTFQKEKLYSGIVGRKYSFSKKFNKMAYFFQGIHIVDFRENKDYLLLDQKDISIWYLVFSQDDEKIIYTTHELEEYYK